MTSQTSNGSGGFLAAPSEGIKSVLLDLTKKLEDIESIEEATRLRHARELAELATRRNKVMSLIEGMREIYPDCQTPSSFQGTVNDVVDPTTTVLFNPRVPSNIIGFHSIDIQDELQQALDTNPEHFVTNGFSKEVVNQNNDNDGRKRRARGALREIVIGAIRDLDFPASIDDVFEYIHANHPGEGLERKDVGTSLKDGRRSKVVVAYPVYDKSGGRSYLNGLPDFYSDANPDHLELKPEYQEKLLQRAIELDLLLDAPHDQLNNTSSGGSEIEASMIALMFNEE